MLRARAGTKQPPLSGPAERQEGNTQSNGAFFPQCCCYCLLGMNTDSPCKSLYLSLLEIFSPRCIKGPFTCKHEIALNFCGSIGGMAAAPTCPISGKGLFPGGAGGEKRPRQDAGVLQEMMTCSHAWSSSSPCNIPGGTGE